MKQLKNTAICHRVVYTNCDKLVRGFETGIDLYLALTNLGALISPGPYGIGFLSPSHIIKATKGYLVVGPLVLVC